MTIHKAWCLFEQSGTFKNEFRKLGIPAEDYDILNDFGETDHVTDLFDEIDRCYNGEKSLFDGIQNDDLVIAFFPCTRFEVRVALCFRGELHGMENWNDEQKLSYAMRIHRELHNLYMAICKLFIISNRGGGGLLLKTLIHSPITSRCISRLSPS
jgi:hypothetical protein